MVKRKKLHPILKIIILLIIFFALICVDSRYRLVLTKYEVAVNDLPDGFEGFKMIQLSDLHGTEFGEGSKRLAELVKKAEPDIIALTGDFVDEESDLEVLDALLPQLTEIAPVYYVSGNHEWASGILSETADILERRGAVYLSNDYVLLERGGESIVLAGVEDPNGWSDMPKPDEVVDIIKNEQGDRPIILLGHRNYWLDEYPELSVDIILCGHAHGGIIRLPFLGGVLGTGFELFPEHIDGVQTSGAYSMIVSRGLGSSMEIPRFLNNPEIVEITLKKG